MNERINLRFNDFTPEVATFMLNCARLFAVDKVRGAAGPRHGIAYSSHGGHVCFAYWTKARAVVVVEQQPKEGQR
jgi:hypothetical protein